MWFPQPAPDVVGRAARPIGRTIHPDCDHKPLRIQRPQKFIEHGTDAGGLVADWNHDRELGPAHRVEFSRPKSNPSWRYSNAGAAFFERQIEHELAFGNHLSADFCFDCELPQFTDCCALFRAQQNFLLRFHGAEKFHLPNRREQEERARFSGKTGGGGDPRGLGERLGQDHSRDQGVAREMPGEDWVGGGKDRGAFRVFSRLATHQLPNENKRGPMGQRGEWKVNS